MIELVKFELKKIFNNKIVYIAAIVIAIFIVGVSIVNTTKTKAKLGTKEEVQALAESYINGDYTNKDINELSSEASKKIEKVRS